MKVTRILVPVDFSDPSRQAVKHAAWLAGKLGAKVDVLHVASRPVEYLPLEEWIFGEARGQKNVEEKVLEAAQKAFTRFLNEFSEATRGKLTTRVETGVPSQVIIQVTEDDEYDMVVMGTHGRTGAKHATLGSTAERVLRKANCPVLVVH